MKKLLLSLLVLLIFNTATLATEQPPLHLWTPYDPENPGDFKNIDKKYIFIRDTDLEQIKNSGKAKKTDPGKPPVSYQITSVDYLADIAKDEIKIKGVYKINKLDDKWALVPVLSSKTAVTSAVLGETPASITTDKNYHALTLKKKGNYVLTLNFTEKIKEAASRNTRSFSFTQPVMPITNLECRINRPDIAFDITNAVAIRPFNLAGSSKAIASLLPTGNINVRWTPKSTLISDIKPDNNLPPSANAVTYSKIEAGRGALKGTFTAELDIRRSPLGRFEFYIPEGIEIDSITVQDNEPVDPYPEIRDNVLPVELVSPVEGKTRLTLHFRRNFNDSSFKTKIPAITLVNENIDRETGYVALVETTNIESSIVKSDETKNYREIDSNELEGDLRGLKSSIALKYTKNKDNIREIPYDITVNIVRHKDVAVYEANIDYTEITSVLNREGGLFTKAVMRLRNTSKQFLEITLPANSSIWSVYVNNKSVKPALKDPEKAIYAIPLVTSASFPVEIVYFTEGVTFPLWTDLRALKTELAANSVKWAIYTPKNKDFIPLGLFSNLLKDKKTHPIGCSQVADGVNAAPPGAVKEKMSLYESEEKSFRDYFSVAPQRVYKSKKVGKLPVYVDLPLIGKSHKFYQLSFEAEKSPKIAAIYINDLIPDILALLILLTIAYTAFKSDKIRGMWLPPVAGTVSLIKFLLTKWRAKNNENK